MKNKSFINFSILIHMIEKKVFPEKSFSKNLFKRIENSETFLKAVEVDVCNVYVA